MIHPLRVNGLTPTEIQAALPTGKAHNLIDSHLVQILPRTKHSTHSTKE